MNFDYPMNQISYGAVQLTKNANSLYMHMQKRKIQEALPAFFTIVYRDYFFKHYLIFFFVFDPLLFDKI